MYCKFGVLSHDCISLIKYVVIKWFQYLTPTLMTLNFKINDPRYDLSQKD